MDFLATSGRWVRAAGAVLAGALALVGCGGSPSGGVGTPISGTFIDAPVEGLSYQAAGWAVHGTLQNWASITSSKDGSKLAAVVQGGQIYTSSDSGVNWTARDRGRGWQSIASSADGTKLAAVVNGGQIYTSSDSGLTWAAQENFRTWISITSSADGSKLAAVVQDGQIYTSSDSGVNWTARDRGRGWQSIASSADGTKLAAVVNGGQIYTSSDSGVNWTVRGSPQQSWQSITSSADGSKLAAVVYGGQIYTSSDSGVNWIARDKPRTWLSITSSADGSKLAAVVNGGQIYTSSDSGVNWIAREFVRYWKSIASSDDGSKLAAVLAGRIFTYAPTTKLTGATGNFNCTTGQDVTFSLGNQVLGAVKCGEAVHVYHMAGASDSVEKGVRVARLLQSLNISTDASKIKLPDLTGINVNVRLDTNDTEFESNVLTLMGQLSGKGLVNATPVTRAVAVAHVQSELDALSDTQKTKMCSDNYCTPGLLGALLKPGQVKVSVTNLAAGQSIELRFKVGTTDSAPLNIQQPLGATTPLPTLTGGFLTVPSNGQSYTVSGADSNPAVSCTLGSNASGTYDVLAPPTVAVACSTNAVATTTLKANVSGLGPSQSVTLKNGADTVSVSSNGLVTISSAVAAGSSYQLATTNPAPTNLTCTVGDSTVSGSGRAPVDVYSPNTSVVTVNVVCGVTGNSVGGTVTGLANGASVGLVLSSSDGNANRQTVRILAGGTSTDTYVFPNVTVASGQTFSLALDGAAPQGYGCTIASVYASAISPFTINANVTNADVGCGPMSVSGITPSGTVTAGMQAAFTVTGAYLPTTAILALDGTECVSSAASASGFTASCMVPTPTSPATTVSAQVNSNTAASSGTAIGSPVSVTVGAGGGGVPPGGGGGSCGTAQTLPGSLNGTITGLSASGLSSITLTTPVTGSAQAVVNYSSGCTSQVFTFDTLLSGGTNYGVQATAVGYTCTVTNGSGVMGSSPVYVGNVTVACQ